MSGCNTDLVESCGIKTIVKGPGRTHKVAATAGLGAMDVWRQELANETLSQRPCLPCRSTTHCGVRLVRRRSLSERSLSACHTFGEYEYVTRHKARLWR